MLLDKYYAKDWTVVQSGLIVFLFIAIPFIISYFITI